MIFAAFLALFLFHGVNAQDGGVILGFVKVRPAAIPTVLFFVVGYLSYEFYLARLFQNDEIRNRTRKDFIFTTAFAALVLFGYLIFYLLWQVVGLSSSVLIAVSVSVLASVFAAFATIRWNDLDKWQREAFNLRKSTVEQRLKEPGWILNFNPKSSAGKKEISFNNDGTIGLGRNDNESTWVLYNDQLVIRQSTGEVQNTFAYDPNTDQFKSISAARKFGIPGQFIYRPT